MFMWYVPVREHCVIHLRYETYTGKNRRICKNSPTRTSRYTAILSPDLGNRSAFHCRVGKGQTNVPLGQSAGRYEDARKFHQRLYSKWSQEGSETDKTHQRRQNCYRCRREVLTYAQDTGCLPASTTRRKTEAG